MYQLLNMYSLKDFDKTTQKILQPSLKQKSILQLADLFEIEVKIFADCFESLLFLMNMDLDS